jgi:N-acetylglucosamine-6-phosphate deacetylase
MVQTVHSSVRFLGIPVEDAIRLASETAAEIPTLSRKGRVALETADLVAFYAEEVVQQPIVAGKSV